MIGIVELIARGEWMGTCVSGGVWLAFVYGCFLALRRFNVAQSVRGVLAAGALMELFLHLFRREDWDPTFAAAALHWAYLPLVLTSWGAVIFCICRVPALDNMLPMRGKWLSRLLLAYAAIGLTLLGPGAHPVWRSVYSSGLMGQAYGLSGPLGCFGPSQQEIVTAWAFILIGIPLLTVCNGALLASIHAGSTTRVQSISRRAIAGFTAYGRRLQRSESLW